MRVHVLSIVQALHDLFRYYTIFLPDIQRVDERTALCKVQIAMQTNIFVGFVLVALAYDKHFRKILFAFAHADQFGFQETQG